MLYQKTFQKFEIIPALCRAPNMAGPMSSDQLAVQKIVAIDAHEHVAQRWLSMDHAESDAALSDTSDDEPPKTSHQHPKRSRGNRNTYFLLLLLGLWGDLIRKMRNQIMPSFV